MTWTDQAWEAFCGLLEHGWPGEFDDNAADAYRLLLDRHEPGEVVAAVRKLVERGGTFRPSVSEIVGAINADPSKPAWPEAYQAIRRCLFVHPDVAALERAAEAHHLIAAFMRAAGVGRLRVMPLDDPKYGPVEQQRLREQWDEFIDVAEDRIATGRALPTGDRRSGLERFDPLAALERLRPAELEAGEGEAA